MWASHLSGSQATSSVCFFPLCKCVSRVAVWPRVWEGCPNTSWPPANLVLCPLPWVACLLRRKLCASSHHFLGSGIEVLGAEVGAAPWDRESKGSGSRIVRNITSLGLWWDQRRMFLLPVWLSPIWVSSACGHLLAFTVLVHFYHPVAEKFGDCARQSMKQPRSGLISATHWLSQAGYYWKP